MSLRVERAMLGGTLVLSLILGGVGIWWGLPAIDSWAFDEIRPQDVIGGLAQRFAAGWAGPYPPFHYAVLGLFFGPLLVARRAGWITLPEVEFHGWLYLLGRGLSLLLATAAVYLVYRWSRRLGDRPTAILASLTAALSCPLVFYAKTMNLDVPYVFWLMLSVVLLLRVLGGHRLSAYLALAAAAALATATKDQAFAFYVLPAVALPIALAAHRREAEGRRGGVAVLADRRLVLGALVGSLVFLLAHNLPMNLAGFRRHIEIITQSSPRFDLYEATLAGHLQMGWQSLRHLAFILGAPLAVAAAAGLGLELRSALRSRDRQWRRWVPLAMALSYYLCFITVIRHNFVRFLLPVALLLSWYAARALVALARHPRLPRPATALVIVAALGWALLRAASVDLRLLYDVRPEVEQWLRIQVEDPGQVVALGRQNMLPRGLQVAPFFLRHPPERVLRNLERRGVAWMVLSPDDLKLDGPAGRGFLDAVSSPRSPYRLERAWKGRPPLDWLDTEGMLTNLGSLNPEMRVYRLRSKAGDPPR